MENANMERVLGIILGQVLRIQRKMGDNSIHPATIYALVNGIEGSLDDVFEELGVEEESDFLTKSKISVVKDVLMIYSKQIALGGYYAVESNFQERGISREEAIPSMKYLYSKGYCQKEISDIANGVGNTNSPMEFSSVDKGIESEIDF